MVGTRKEHLVNTQAEDAHESYTVAAGHWTRQVQAFRQSVSLYRQVGILRSRRRRNARTTAAAIPPPPTYHQIQGATVSRPALRLLAPSEQADDAPTHTPACPLTPRQLEVAELIASGKTNSQIARELVLTPGTVANHIEHILRRLDVPNRAAAATWLARERPRLVRRSTDDTSESPDLR